ncbi:MAG: response regulator [Armatimonadota bacterium]|jgi:CheY-like chemotaxis protein
MGAKRILVIDDELPVARLIAAALSEAKVEHVLEHCTDGAQGRIKALQGRYDLIALDLAMPLMDGLTALAQMKQDPKSAHIPVVVITGLGDPELHKRAMDLGAAAIVTKPFEAAFLAGTLVRILADESPRSSVEGFRPLGT